MDSSEMAPLVTCWTVTLESIARTKLVVAVFRLLWKNNSRESIFPQRNLPERLPRPVVLGCVLTPESLSHSLPFQLPLLGGYADPSWISRLPQPQA